MAAASSRRPAKKRKISADLPSSTVAQPKPKSILAGRPQNFYAPPNPDQMTKEELAAWRKEERKKRNRESAAASRNKIKGRITELESELSEWKQKYADMEDKMRAMEQHIQLLTQLNGNSSSTQGQDVPLPPPTAISHPNSPQISPVPSTVTSFALPPPASSSSHTIPNVPNLFPNLLSEPQNSAKVETQQVASPDDVATIVKSKEDIKSRAHKIERQAVKSPGAFFESSDMDKTVKQHEQDMQLAGLPTCDSTVMNEGDGKVFVDVGSSTPKSVEAVAGNEVLNHQDSTTTLETSSTSESSESSSFESSDDDGGDDFLDLLVDSLDGEFDPALLI